MIVVDVPYILARGNRERGPAKIVCVGAVDGCVAIRCRTDGGRAEHDSGRLRHVLIIIFKYVPVDIESNPALEFQKLTNRHKVIDRGGRRPIKILWVTVEPISSDGNIMYRLSIAIHEIVGVHRDAIPFEITVVDQFGTAPAHCNFVAGDVVHNRSNILWSEPGSNRIKVAVNERHVIAVEIHQNSELGRILAVQIAAIPYDVMGERVLIHKREWRGATLIPAVSIQLRSYPVKQYIVRHRGVRDVQPDKTDVVNARKVEHWPVLRVDLRSGEGVVNNPVMLPGVRRNAAEHAPDRHIRVAIAVGIIRCRPGAVVGPFACRASGDRGRAGVSLFRHSLPVVHDEGAAAGVRVARVDIAVLKRNGEMRSVGHGRDLKRAVGFRDAAHAGHIAPLIDSGENAERRR